MSLQHSVFLFLTVVLLTLDHVSGDKVIQITAHWRKVFSEQNNSPVPVSYTRRFTSGLKTREVDERTIVAQHTVGAGHERGVEAGISVGDILKVLSIDFKFTFQYSFQHSTTTKTVREAEIHKSKEQTVTFTVPAWTRLERWQLVADIAGVEYDGDHMLTTTNTTEEPGIVSANATVQFRKQILFGRTPIRIKQIKNGRYIIVISRKDWPYAKQGSSNQFHFILHDAGRQGIRIQTLNTMYPGFEYMYSADARGLYFDESKTGSDFNGKQYWHLSKSPPLYDGVVVSFRNNEFGCYLCYKEEGFKLECMDDYEDEWMLEVV